MRQLVAVAACVALAACGGSKDDETPERTEDVAATATPSPSAAPTEAETETNADEPAVAPSLVLTRTGLVVGKAAFDFEAGQPQVEAALKTLMGDPVSSGPMPECGAGPMSFADYGGGIAVNFQDGKLVGWNLSSPRDGDEPAKAGISVEGPTQLGSTRAAVESQPGFAMFEDSTLGEEFQLGDDLFGFFEEGKVSMLNSGTQCFFR